MSRSAELEALVGGYVGEAVTGAMPCEVVRPDLLPRDPGDALSSLNRFLDGLRSEHPGDALVRDVVGAAHAACRDALDAVVRGTGCAFPEEAIAEVGRVMTRVNDRRGALLDALRDLARASVEAVSQDEADLAQARI